MTFHLMRGFRHCPLLWLGLLASSVFGEERYEFQSKHMGTVFRIVVYAPSRQLAEQAAEAGFARVAELDGLMSDYKNDSELNRLCRAFSREVGPPVRVSEDLFHVLEHAETLSRASDGAFDVTVGPVVQLWRLARRTQQLPEEMEFAQARAKVGWHKVRLDAASRSVQLLMPGMQLDLGGIAKGYAADAVMALLRERFGISRALVAAAGDIRCGEPPPHRDAWLVDIAPLTPQHPPRRLKLANRAVSTSGDLEQFVVIQGVRYSHILNPRTGLGLTGRRSVTVIAREGVTADSLTKAVSVLPPAQAFALVDATPDAAACIAQLDEQGALQVQFSKRFATYEADAATR